MTSITADAPGREVRLGLVGLGRMGLPVCRNLVRAGYEVVANDSRAELEAEAAAAGARWGASPHEAADDADVLVTVLPSATELSEAMLGSRGALGALRGGATWIDMSTCSPRAAGELVDSARGREVRCLDAPMGGGPGAAWDATLSLFVGGDRELVEQWRDLLAAVADPGGIVHVGANGAGYLAKLLVNALWFGQALATAEALLLAQKEGLDIEVMRSVLAGSPASSRFIAEDLTALLDGDYLASFALDRCHDELEAVATLAREAGAPHELADVVERIYGRALERYGAVDGELLGVALLEEEAGLRLRRERGQ
jgi:3-hydroxyisobutyrate dehydrogenase